MDGEEELDAEDEDDAGRAFVEHFNREMMDQFLSHQRKVHASFQVRTSISEQFLDIC